MSLISRGTEMADQSSMTIAVTGSSGFVGQWVERRLKSSSNCEHINIVRLLENADGSRIDIRNFEEVGKRISATQPASIIHLAAVAAPREANENPANAWETNVMGTLSVAQGILDYSPETKLIFAGSAEAYGNSFNKVDGPIKETMPFEPAGTYGATKAACDIMLGQMAYQGLKSVRFRPFNHTGPEQSAVYVASDFARQIALIENDLQAPELHVGNLSAKRDFMDVRDVADVYIAAATNFTHGDENSTVYNISTGTPTSIEELLQMLIKASSVNISIKVDESRFRKNDIKCASGDPKLLKGKLGWEPKYSLSDTLNNLLDYWRNQISSYNK